MKLDNPKFIVFKYADGLKPMTNFCDTEEEAIETFSVEQGKLLDTDGDIDTHIANIRIEITEWGKNGNFELEYPNGEVASFCLAEVYLIGMDVENTTEQEDAYAIINEKEHNKFETNFHSTIISTLTDFIYKDHKVGDELITDVVGKVNHLSEKFAPRYNWKYKDYKMIKVILP